MGEPSTKHLLIEICELLPEHHTLTADLLGLHGIGYNLATTHGGADSPIEQAWTMFEHRQGLLDPLTDIAADWGWTNTDGMPIAWMAHNIDRVEQQRGTLDPDHIEAIRKVHATLTRIIHKPSHPQPTPEETRNRLILEAKLGHDIWVTRHQLSQILNINRATIRDHIRRGRYTPRKDGKLNLRHAL